MRSFISCDILMGNVFKSLTYSILSCIKLLLKVISMRNFHAEFKHNQKRERTLKKKINICKWRDDRAHIFKSCLSLSWWYEKQKARKIHLNLKENENMYVGIIIWGVPDHHLKEACWIRWDHFWNRFLSHPFSYEFRDQAFWKIIFK